PRILPEGLGVEIDLDTWLLPPVFAWLAETGGLSEAELLKTFNAGIGLVSVVAPEAEAEITAALSEVGETVTRSGQVAATPGLRYSGGLL
ncbi:MAG: AIR synthase-related protein, partial [Pseudomonadota bacterium]